MNVPKQQSVDAWLKNVRYMDNSTYIPSLFALQFVNFIKMVNEDAQGEEHETPLMHYHMLDNVAGRRKNIANLAFRGSAKTSIFSNK